MILAINYYADSRLTTKLSCGQAAKRVGRQLQRLVYARHGHDLLGCKSPISEPQYLDFKILQLLAKGNCKAARLCGEEACSKAVSRRTETS